jgi:hypothetical protein
MHPDKPPLSKRIVNAFRYELKRIKSQYEPVKTGYKRPSFWKRVRRFFLSPFVTSSDRKRTSYRQFPRKPSLSKRIKLEIEDRRITKMKQKGLVHGNVQYVPVSKRFRYFMKEQRSLFSTVFSRDYLVILVNSLSIFLLSFFVVYFLTQMLTGVTAYYTDISTLLNYSIIDYKIHSYDWSFTQVMAVFSIPCMVILILILVIARTFENKKEDEGMPRWYQMITNKQRERIFTRSLDEIKPKKKRRKRNWFSRQRKGIELSGYMRLFLLWAMFHMITYFFSGMLFSVLFYRRIGYAIWHMFDYYNINFFFAAIAFIFLLVLGFVYAGQFLSSGKMYFNHLVDRNRMPFIMAQVILPFYLGLIIIVLLMIPDISYTLTAMNFSMLFLLLPVQLKSAHYPEIQYDKEEKDISIKWDWVFLSFVIVLALYLPLKIGIFIQL